MFKRRSPFEGASEITVYLRSDVEKRAIELWGSREILEVILDRFFNPFGIIGGLFDEEIDESFWFPPILLMRGRIIVSN